MGDTNEVAKLVERLKIEASEDLDGEVRESAIDAMRKAADALTRIAAERDEAVAVRADRNQTIMRLHCQEADLQGAVRAAERERDTLKAEVERLREIVSQCAAALPNGAFIAPTASLEFMGHLPNEIALVCDAFLKACEDARAALAFVKEEFE